MINYDILYLKMRRVGIPVEVIEKYISNCKTGFFPEIEFDEIPSDEYFVTMGEVYAIYKKKKKTMPFILMRRYAGIPFSRVEAAHRRICELFDLDAKTVSLMYDTDEMFDVTAEQVEETCNVLTEAVKRLDYRQRMVKRALLFCDRELTERFRAVTDAVDADMAEEVIYITSVDGYLLYPYDVDPIKGIEYLRQHFDTHTLTEILLKENMFLYCFKDEDYICGRNEEARLEARLKKMLEKYPRKQ